MKVDRRLIAVIAAVVIFVVVASTMVGCSPVKAMDGEYHRMGPPDNYGVVCYEGRTAAAFACVQVTRP